MNSFTSSSSAEDIRRFLRRLSVFILMLVPCCVLASLLANSTWFDGTYITAQNYKLAEMRSHPPYDLIVMGDSCPMAIDVTAPETTRFLGNRSAFNFALVNLGGVYPLYSTLDKYLSNGPPPRVVLLSFLPSLLSGTSDIVAGSRFTKFYAAKFYSLHDTISDPVLRSHPRLVGQLLLEKYRLRFMQYRYDIPRNEYMIQRLKKTRGQLLILEDTAATEQEVLESAQYKAQFSVSPDSNQYLREFLDLARHKGVAVLLFEMPVPADVLRHRNTTGFYEAYFKYVDQLARQFDNFFYVNTLFSLPNQYFSYDVTHLNRAGAERFQREQWPLVLRDTLRLFNAPDSQRVARVTGDASYGALPQGSLHSGTIPGSH